MCKFVFMILNYFLPKILIKYPTTKNVKATKLTGGIPFQPPGLSQPLKPIKNKCNPPNNIVNSRKFLDVTILMKPLSSRKL
ncbi:MAG: hypothetical protein KAG14_01505, partial [Mycoplasmataceae bacterium]|nr:hypothetical protein [Mycoplasmataceae bacterium]